MEVASTLFGKVRQVRSYIQQEEGVTAAYVSGAFVLKKKMDLNNWSLKSTQRVMSYRCNMHIKGKAGMHMRIRTNHQNGAIDLMNLYKDKYGVYFM